MTGKNLPIHPLPPQIASGSADAGMGIYSAARLYDLDFLPICTEQYDLLIPDSAWELPAVQDLIRTMQTEEFRTRLEELGGYSLDQPDGYGSIFKRTKVCITTMTRQ